MLNIGFSFGNKSNQVIQWKYASLTAVIKLRVDLVHIYICPSHGVELIFTLYDNITAAIQTSLLKKSIH